MLAVLVTLVQLHGLVTPPTDQRPQSELDTCSLDGSGNVGRCERIYWRSRIIATALPSYAFATDGHRGFHGLSWGLSVDIPKDFWASYFTLGVKSAPPPSSSNPFRISVGATFAWFPKTSDVIGAISIRIRVISLGFPNSPVTSFVHLSVGLGGFVNRYGPGPRVELRARLGHLAWGGVVVALAYEPNILINRHVGQLTVGFEAPWMWWW